MMNDERQYIIAKLMGLPLRAFYGTLNDLEYLRGLFAIEDDKEFTKKEDDFLNKLYVAHVNVILECFTCFKQGVPMRLIKLDEETVRIICDSCRENLHSAKSN